MSVENHLAELERRHQHLEKEIEASKLHPAEDPLKIAELKRKKLKLRDEMNRLQHGAESRAGH